jgi:hypothetical protein
VLVPAWFEAATSSFVELGFAALLFVLFEVSALAPAVPTPSDVEADALALLSDSPVSAASGSVGASACAGGLAPIDAAAAVVVAASAGSPSWANARTGAANVQVAIAMTNAEWAERPRAYTIEFLFMLFEALGAS